MTMTMSTTAESLSLEIQAVLAAREMTGPEMEKIRGGYWLVEGCKHNFVRTGRTQEASFFIFWTHTEYEETCTKCNYTRWSY